MTQRPEIDRGEIIIERAVPDDAEAILRIKQARWMDTYVSDTHNISVEDVLNKFSNKDLKEGIKNWRNGLREDAKTNNPNRAVFVARLHGDVIGFTTPNIESDGRRRLGALYVASDQQGLGVGAKLLQKALEWHGADNDVYLFVVSYNNHAIDFYVRQGFEKTGLETQEEFDIKQGIKLLPEIEMVHRAINA